MSKMLWTAVDRLAESIDCALDRIPAYARDENGRRRCRGVCWQHEPPHLG